ncbi:MAG: hypothetical protein LAO03_08145 [Acidobacteriia bacterium]|nr:hypothetical protein [Terriglobia bacterium]
MATKPRPGLARLRTKNVIPGVLDRRLLLYALAAGATLAAAPASQAQIVFTPSNALLQGLGKFDIDLDNDGSADFTIVAKWTQYDTSNMIQAIFAYGDGPSNYIVTLGGGDALALKKNAPIGSGRQFAAVALMETPIYGGLWQNAKNRSLGVKFLINGEVHYGWIGFRGVHDIPVAIKLYGWAYETQPNQKILAGDTGTSAPTDGSFHPTSLEILASGHTAIEPRRKRTGFAGGH